MLEVALTHQPQPKPRTASIGHPLVRALLDISKANRVSDHALEDAEYRPNPTLRWLLKTADRHGCSLTIEKLPAQKRIHFRPSSQKPHKRGRKAGCFTEPSTCMPLVAQLFQEIASRKIYLHEFAERAGISREALTKWRSNSPRVLNFEAALNTLDLELVLVRKGR